MPQSTIVQWTERVQSIPNVEPLYANDLFVGILIVCFFVLAMVLADKGNLLGDMLRGFFQPREYVAENVKTSRVFYMRMGMYAVFFMSLSLIMTISVVSVDPAEIMNVSRILPFSFVLFVALYLLKQGICRAVNWVFFDRPQAEMWYNSYSNWIILSAVPLYIVSALSVFLNWSLSIMAVIVIIYVVLIEICLLYKAFHIFCVKKYGSLQLIVYLCSLELIPLLLVGKVLVLYFV